MYTIGEFSQITSITVKALHHYDEKGLLVPVYRDQESGYRYYGEQEVERARVISVMKSMRFSLTEIATLLEEFDDESQITQWLERKKATIDADIAKLNSVSEALETILIKEQEVANMSHNSDLITIKHLSPIEVISIRWQGKYAETGKAMGKLYHAGGRHAAGAAFNLYFDGEYREISNIESCLPIKKAIKSKLDQQSLPGGRFVTYVHQGPYERIGESYKKLFDYIKQNGEQAALPTREVYLKGPGMIFKGNPEKYLTEIQIPLKG
ncbi:MerR family transcriptional regulator [Vibrio sp. WXL103]|uniref:MerR family transcriptional regulator n=1 Tax=Vibrio sp. WXL103 TaxID=3450710 RepID=UPI003EC5C76A